MIWVFLVQFPPPSSATAAIAWSTAIWELKIERFSDIIRGMRCCIMLGLPTIGNLENRGI
ncbi:hypothetical protein SPLC1_S540240 [Arthrospira platensis C1]|nr:hypothetical protein SPLC1_S540240 [Arthrospira platensis C1]